MQPWAAAPPAPLPSTTPGGTATSSATFTYTAPKPVLTLAKSVTPASAVPGTVVTYTLQGKNTGYCTATNVTLTDQLPTGLSYVTGSAGSSSSYNATTGTLTWSLGTLASQSSYLVTFQATVSATATDGSTIPNSATISCSELTTFRNEQQRDAHHSRPAARQLVDVPP